MSTRAAELMGERVRRTPRGFALIEVVVALTILATAGMMLFAWISQNLQTATRLQQAQVRAQLQIEGVRWLGLVNPSLEPSGARDEGDLHLRWTAVLVEPPRGEFDFGGSMLPRWELALYRVQASLRQGESGPKVEWEQLITGWQPVGQARRQRESAALASPAAEARP